MNLHSIITSSNMKNINLVDDNEEHMELLIGQNQKENDQLVRSSHPMDLWFHLDDISSPHFILRCNGKSVTKTQLKYIASLFSQYKKGLGRRYKVIYTEIKNVKLTKTLGTVVPSQLRVVRV